MLESGKTAVEAMRFKDVRTECKDVDGGGNRQTRCVRKTRARRIARIYGSGNVWAGVVTSEPCLREKLARMALAHASSIVLLCFGRQRASGRLIAAHLRLNPLRSAVSIPDRGQRDRQPRHVSQYL
jgi:hypothetical protein